MSFREWSALLYFQTLLKKVKRADQILPEVYGTTLTWIDEEIMYFTDVLPSLVIHCSSNLMETKIKFIKA
jgi:hypothetical protein